MGDPDWDAIARECDLGGDWKEIGFDTADTMLTIYERTESGAILCVWPGCNFARHDKNIEQMFRHVHNPRLHGQQARRKP